MTAVTPIPTSDFSLNSPNVDRLKLAVIFPGQGSQSVAMLADWAIHYPQVQATFSEASEALGFDLWAVCQGMGELNLDETAYTQPALLAASMAIWRILQQEFVVEPRYLAGHSLGEYSALCAAGVFSLSDAVRLVHQRGKLMSQAIQSIEGKMAAVLGLDDGQVMAICASIMAQHPHAIVNPANFNSPGQVVIAGTVEGVDLAIAQVVALGKKAMPLKVSVPSHCQLMQPASDQLAQMLQAMQFKSPTIPVVQNRHARVETEGAAIKQALIEQLSMPVLWSQTQDFFAKQSINLQIECGSGSVLTNLAKRQTAKIPTIATDTPEKLVQIRRGISLSNPSHPFAQETVI